jgi:hypothetical protein
MANPTTAAQALYALYAQLPRCPACEVRSGTVPRNCMCKAREVHDHLGAPRGRHRPGRGEAPIEASICHHPSRINEGRYRCPTSKPGS